LRAEMVFVIHPVAYEIERRKQTIDTSGCCAVPRYLFL
jgi:hypothetical protein